jgi:predicted SAM-dependent methyltransferase
MKIEFGCGETPTQPDFKTCDIRDLPGIDFVCAAWDIDKHVESNSVDEIFSRHFFEHLTFQQGERVLEVWHAILKPGGRCEMLVPNMTMHINQWLRRDTDRDIEHACAGFWGWQRGEFDDVWDVHKSGYDEELLTKLVLRKGFVDVESFANPKKSKHVHLAFYKN